MPRIKVLPLSIRNKIAAGEVIERPASAVKELIENSIDAHSNRIDIEILGAGKRLIRVTDNGSGMDREDALNCFLPHATSKIASEEDLYRITTLGFRGEALSSIASISKMTIVTASREYEGIVIDIEGGAIKGSRPAASKGTMVEARELFFNTPARLKFLKKDFTENNHIIETVTNTALCNELITFNLVLDRAPVLSLPATADRKLRIMQVYGKEFSDRLLETRFRKDSLGIHLFIGESSFYRHHRNSQRLFINQRPVKDPSLLRAVYKALEGIMPKDMHPVCFVYIDIDPTQVDFNVHPAKTEVRFADRERVFHALFSAVKRAYEGEQRTGSGIASLEPLCNTEGNLSKTSQQILDCISVSEQQIPYGDIKQQGVDFIYVTDTILALSDEKGLVLMDYHAIHERINYEGLLKKQIQPQTLLFPCTVGLDIRLYRALLNNISFLDGLGIEIEDFGSGTVLVRTVPEFLVDGDIGNILRDTLEAVLLKQDLSEEEGSDNPVDARRKKAAAMLACHSSLRGKAQRPTGAGIVALLKQLEDTDNPEQCPHGRPTRIFLSHRDLLRMFKRL